MTGNVRYKKITALLDEYGESHQHPVIKLLHWICVLLIVWSLLGLLWSITVPGFFHILALPLNWAVIVVAVSMIYYLCISPILAAGIFLVLAGMMALTYSLDEAGISVWRASAGVFILAWIGQFIGHSIEGKRPSLFKDVQLLLIGPLWLLSFVYRMLGIRY